MVSIFGKELLNDPGLLFEFKQLIGIAETKPFECVGTVSEVNIALLLTIKNYKGDNLPYLLEYYKTLAEYRDGLKTENFPMLYDLNNSHFTEDRYIQIIKDLLND